jgi:hypothetical protein
MIIWVTCTLNVLKEEPYGRVDAVERVPDEIQVEVVEREPLDTIIR